jgi:membrane-bound lytic murein transglycosylase D
LQALLPIIQPIFQEEGVPLDLILVGVVESGYQPDAVSRAQATGIWQFMPETAQRFGLIDEQGDFRTDVLRSTRAAARYLRLLLDQFHDWRLALAAYNAGEDKVEAAIQKARSRDFSTLGRLQLLPEETVQYVPAVLSAIAEARNRGLVDRNYNPRGFYE